jgi:1-deoxy-D-xylulose-5-phosphate reductoisomerase
MDFTVYPELTFEKHDIDTFRNLGLAFESVKKGGNLPCILNAANEIAVGEFLKDKVGFLEMSDVIEHCMQNVSFIQTPDLQDFQETDKETRQKALEVIK